VREITQKTLNILSDVINLLKGDETMLETVESFKNFKKDLEETAETVSDIELYDLLKLYKQALDIFYGAFCNANQTQPSEGEVETRLYKVTQSVLLLQHEIRRPTIETSKLLAKLSNNLQKVDATLPKGSTALKPLNHIKQTLVKIYRDKPKYNQRFLTDLKAYLVNVVYKVSKEKEGRVDLRGQLDLLQVKQAIVLALADLEPNRQVKGTYSKLSVELKEEIASLKEALDTSKDAVTSPDPKSVPNPGILQFTIFDDYDPKKCDREQSTPSRLSLSSKGSVIFRYD